jgi:hypothetical protein
MEVFFYIEYSDFMMFLQYGDHFSRFSVHVNNIIRLSSVPSTQLLSITRFPFIFYKSQSNSVQFVADTLLRVAYAAGALYVSEL